MNAMTHQPAYGDDPSAVVARLLRATNAHDLEAIVACFAPNYENRTPAHPARGFVGQEQVRRNWTQILAGVPDLETHLIASVADGDWVWTEQEHRGTRRDGSPHVLRGVVVFRVAHGVITQARFYLEPLDAQEGGVDDVIRRQLATEEKTEEKTEAKAEAKTEARTEARTEPRTA
jgi:ketosteroid isomerase-like protein